MTDFIAEVCSNHNGDLNRALSLIDTAAEIGCAGVKFQLFRIDKLFAPEALAHPDYRQMLEARRAWELPTEWLPALVNRARHHGIKFGCTPFYLEAVDELLPFVDFFKIASYSLLHDELLVKVARTGKPVALSTGMATLREVERAVELLEGNGCKDLTLLHCVSVYPTPLKETNPGIILRWQTYFDWLDIGWSDHTVNQSVIYFLASMVDMIEFHLDLDGQGNEYGLGHCWLPERISEVIKVVKQLQELTERPIIEMSESEQQERLWRADPSDGLRPLREMRERL